MANGYRGFLWVPTFSAGAREYSREKPLKTGRFVNDCRQCLWVVTFL